MTAPDAADAAVERQARAYAEAVGPHLSPGAPYALLDFPDHSNVGDAAIYAGELAFLDRHAGRPPSYVCSVRSYRGDVERLCPEGPILLHGGGNFGDLWPRYDALRQDVLGRYRHRKVVQLAQSIHYRDPARIEATARAVGRHPDFTLLVRDEESRDLAARRFDCAVRLCPDAAYSLRRLPTTSAGTRPVLSLLRRDRERVEGGHAAALAGLGPVTDWPDWPPWRRYAPRRAFERLAEPRLPPSALLMRRRERAYRRQAARLVRTGVAILEAGRVVVSDRLHAHVLCSLMRRRHLVLDNSYGKVGRYLAAWGDDALAVPAGGPAEIAAQVGALLGPAAARHAAGPAAALQEA